MLHLPTCMRIKRNYGHQLGFKNIYFTFDKMVPQTTLVLLFSLIFVGISNALQACPANCQESECSDLGCVRCKDGFFLFHDPDLGISVCKDECPTGYYVNPVNWCEPCQTTNCVDCSDEYVCKECEENYQVQDGDCIFTPYVLGQK